jgi:hypothetical protein
MDLIRTAFQPLARLAHLLFRTQLKLRLRGGPKLEWVEPEDARRPSPEMQRAARERAELELMLRELRSLLDEDPDTRDSLRHLAYVEQAFQQQGLQALQEVPLQVLRRALDQFEGLVTNWGPRGLASLRSRMAVASSLRSDEDEDESAVQAVQAVSASPPARKVTAAAS